MESSNRFMLLDDIQNFEKTKTKKALNKKDKKNNKIVKNDPTPAELFTFGATINCSAKYILVKALAPNKRLDSCNLFIISKELEQISTDIKALKVTADGNIIIFVTNTTSAECFISTSRATKLDGILVSFEYDLKMNFSKGSIYAPMFKFLEENIIKNGINDSRNTRTDKWTITEARHLTRYVDGKRINTGRIVLTFDTPEPPKTLNALYNKFEITRWYPNPMRCRKCHTFDHHTDRCTLGNRCPKCNVPTSENSNENDHKCDGNFCCACKMDGHITFDRNCPSYIRKKEIRKIAIDQHLSNYETTKLWHKLNLGYVQPNLRNINGIYNNSTTTTPPTRTATYAEIVAKTTTTTSGTEPSNINNINQNSNNDVRNTLTLSHTHDINNANPAQHKPSPTSSLTITHYITNPNTTNPNNTHTENTYNQINKYNQINTPIVTQTIPNITQTNQCEKPVENTDEIGTISTVENCPLKPPNTSTTCNTLNNTTTPFINTPHSTTNTNEVATIDLDLLSSSSLSAEEDNL